MVVAGSDGSINLYAGQTQNYVNGYINGSVVDLSQNALQQQQQGVIPTNLIAVCEFVSFMSWRGGAFCEFVSFVCHGRCVCFCL